MATLTADMKRIVIEQRLGFHATVNVDGSPNLSPKGTTAVWDDEHLFFADIRSPRTIANLRRGSPIEVNVVDPILRKGYRFRGIAKVCDRGSSEFEEGLRRLKEAGYTTDPDTIKAFAIIEIQHASPLISPAYDSGSVDERMVAETWLRHVNELHHNPMTAATTRLDC